MEPRTQDQATEQSFGGQAKEQSFGSSHGASGSGANTTDDREVVRAISYPFGDRQRAELDQQFTYHPPQPNQLPRYEAIRQKARELAELYVTSTPPSREQSLAITNLQTSAFWANAAIARNEVPSL